jgi:hypothetical protein
MSEITDRLIDDIQNYRNMPDAIQKLKEEIDAISKAGLSDARGFIYWHQECGKAKAEAALLRKALETIQALIYNAEDANGFLVTAIIVEVDKVLRGEE